MNHEALANTLGAMGYAKPATEYQFCTRKWRFDLAWPQHLLAVEIQGGIYRGGRHTRGRGYENDCEKMIAAQLAGWRVFYVPPGWFTDGRIFPILEQAFACEVRR